MCFWNQRENKCAYSTRREEGWATARSGSPAGPLIDPATGALTAIGTFNAGTAPISVAVARVKPSVRAVYTTNAGANTVSVIDPSTNTVLTTVTVGPNPVDAAFTPNGATEDVTQYSSVRITPDAWLSARHLNIKW